MNKFTVYKTDWCPYCNSALNFINNLKAQRDDIEVEIINAEEEPEKFSEIMKEVGRSTVPQIFLNNEHIGGWDDLSKLSSSGKLEEKL